MRQISTLMEWIRMRKGRLNIKVVIRFYMLLTVMLLVGRSLQRTSHKP
jgi:hypothetical protein